MERGAADAGHEPRQVGAHRAVDAERRDVGRVPLARRPHGVARGQEAACVVLGELCESRGVGAETVEGHQRHRQVVTERLGGDGVVCELGVEQHFEWRREGAHRCSPA